MKYFLPVKAFETFNISEVLNLWISNYLDILSSGSKKNSDEAANRLLAKVQFELFKKTIKTHQVGFFL